MADPISLGSCALWLDASVASSISATGGAVDTWADQSGNGRDATATTTLRPTTGTRTYPVSALNVLDFNGTTNMMHTPSFVTTTPFTVAAVIQNDSGANSTQQMIMSDVTNSRSIQKGASNAWLVFDGNTLSAGTVNTSAHYLIATCVSAGAILSIDGTETSGSTGTGAWQGGINIGGSAGPANFWNGTIAELVIYALTVGSSDRAALGAYFTDKWFTTAHGPSTDPVVSPTAVHRAANW